MKKPTETYTDETPMPWGTHKGTPLGELEDSYLRWLSDQDWLPKWPQLHAYISAQDLPPEQEIDDDQTYGTYEDFLSDR